MMKRKIVKLRMRMKTTAGRSYQRRKKRKSKTCQTVRILQVEIC